MRAQGSERAARKPTPRSTPRLGAPSIYRSFSRRFGLFFAASTGATSNRDSSRILLIPIKFCSTSLLSMRDRPFSLGPLCFRQRLPAQYLISASTFMPTTLVLAHITPTQMSSYHRFFIVPFSFKCWDFISICSLSSSITYTPHCPVVFPIKNTRTTDRETHGLQAVDTFLYLVRFRRQRIVDALIC